MERSSRDTFETAGQMLGTSWHSTQHNGVIDITSMDIGEEEGVEFPRLCVELPDSNSEDTMYTNPRTIMKMFDMGLTPVNKSARQLYAQYSGQ